MAERQESGGALHQSKCGCWKSTAPKRRPWYYKRGDWCSWKPFSIGGDEWCRWTLVVGFGLITGVVVIPLWECRGCEDCGPDSLDGIGQPQPLTYNEAVVALEVKWASQREWDLAHPEDTTEGVTQ